MQEMNLKQISKIFRLNKNTNFCNCIDYCSLFKLLGHSGYTTTHNMAAASSSGTSFRAQLWGEAAELAISMGLTEALVFPPTCNSALPKSAEPHSSPTLSQQPLQIQQTALQIASPTLVEEWAKTEISLWQTLQVFNQTIANAKQTKRPCKKQEVENSIIKEHPRIDFITLKDTFDQ